MTLIVAKARIKDNGILLIARYAVGDAASRRGATTSIRWPLRKIGIVVPYSACVVYSVAWMGRTNL